MNSCRGRWCIVWTTCINSGVRSFSLLNQKPAGTTQALFCYQGNASSGRVEVNNLAMLNEVYVMYVFVVVTIITMLCLERNDKMKTK